MTTKRKKTVAVAPEVRAAALAEWEGGGRAEDIARRIGVTAAAIYWWKKQRDKGKRQAVVAVPVDGPDVAASAVNTRNAVMFLRKGKSELLTGIRNGEINDLDPVHMLAMLALHSLGGK